MPGDSVVVLVLAAGAAWESRALRLLEDSADLTVLKRCVDVDDLLASASTGQADAAVVAADAPGLDSRAVDHLTRHGVHPVGVAGARTDPDATRLRASRIGVRGMVLETELDRLPARLRREEVDPPSPEEQPSAAPAPTDLAPGTVGKVVAIWGPHGAPGRTTLACGIAAELGRRQQQVLLVDADPWGGSVAQQLGILDETSGMLSAARLATAGTLVERFSGVQRSLDNGVRVVTGLPRADRYVEVRPGTVEHLLETGRTRGQVVVDCGFSLEDDPGADFGTRPGRNTMTLGALTVADEVLVVGSADPVGLSRLARGLVELREVLAGAPVRVVVNRNRPTLGWSERDVAGMVEGFAHLLGLHFLPEDRTAVDRALVEGQSIVSGAETALARGIGEVVDGAFPSAVQPAPTRGRKRPRRPQAAKSR